MKLDTAFGGNGATAAAAPADQQKSMTADAKACSTPNSKGGPAAFTSPTRRATVEASPSGVGASEHQTHATFAAALNRTLSWDLPEPPRHKQAVRQSISDLHPPAHAPLDEDEDLPTPEPFKVKMVETIT